MISTEIKQELKTMFSGTKWRIEDINTITDEQIESLLVDFTNYPISNADIIIACEGLNFAQLYARAKARQRSEQILEQIRAEKRQSLQG
jgi:hypothetical protein